MIRPPDRIIGDPDAPYLLRWHVIPRNKWFNIYLHRFCRSDDDRAQHDHPWVNVSILLRGRYREHRLGRPTRLRRPGLPIFRRPTATHRIELLRAATGQEQPVWTLFVTGPVVREWGFHCPQGWRHWTEFASKSDRGNTIGKGCD